MLLWKSAKTTQFLGVLNIGWCEVGVDFVVLWDVW